MQTLRTRHTQGILAATLFTGALIATTPAMAQNTAAFEPAPSLPAADIAPATAIKSPLHKLAESVKIDNYFGVFVIESNFGKFTVTGVPMLNARVHELQAIEKLQKVSQSAAFQDALKNSATALGKFAETAVSDPGKAAESVGKGVETVFGNLAYLAKKGANAVGDTASDMTSSRAKPAAKAAPAGEPEPPSFTGDPFGYNKARREWSKQLGIDPYTSNPVLRPLLDNAAQATFAGNFAISSTIGAIAAPASLAVSFDATVRDSVWNQSPLDLAQANEQKLLALGVDARVVRDFLRSKWFTPTLQTGLTAALVRFGKIGGIDAVIRAAAVTQGETRARFLVDSVRMLVLHHEKSGPLASIKMSNLVPVGVTKDGALVVSVAVDYASWDKGAASFTTRKELTGKQKTLLVAGKTSARAQQELAKAGWTVKAGQRP